MLIFLNTFALKVNYITIATKHTIETLTFVIQALDLQYIIPRR